MAIRPFAYVALIAGMLGSPVAGQPAAASCRIEGWSRDPDPAGLRVRAAPGMTARVLGRLPPLHTDEDGRRTGPTFRIVGARNGWLHIENVRVEDGRRTRAFPRDGWVHGGLVGFAVQDSRGYAAPDARSAVVVSTGDQWLTPTHTIVGVLDCTGVWAKVALRIGTRTKPAWVTGICANQWTSCDMPSVAHTATVVQ